MTTVTILWITLIIYLIIMLCAYIFNVKWLTLVAGLLWFVPITTIDNSFIILVSVVMLLVHGFLGLHTNNSEEF